MNIKVLTLWQPWATLHVYGLKKNETRPKYTRHKGLYLIHAAKSFPPFARELCETEPFKSLLQSIGITNWKQLPTGVIVGEVQYSGYGATALNKDAKVGYAKGTDTYNAVNPDEVEMALGDYSTGRFVWMGEKHRPLAEPIPYKNGQGYYLPYKGDYNKLVFKTNG